MGEDPVRRGTVLQLALSLEVPWLPKGGFPRSKDRTGSRSPSSLKTRPCTDDGTCCLDSVAHGRQCAAYPCRTRSARRPEHDGASTREHCTAPRQGGEPVAGRCGYDQPQRCMRHQSTTRSRSCSGVSPDLHAAGCTSGELAACCAFKVVSHGRFTCTSARCSPH